MTPRRNTTRGSVKVQHPKAPKGGSKGGDSGKKTGKGK